MGQQPLSRVERVDLRKVWKDEAKDFTKWLAENIDVLGDALGLNLDPSPQTEVKIGDYWLDILATDSDGNSVVIENQLEASDHDHLGKLLTYAAGREAGVVVWVAQEFRDEHRKAIDWLNQRTARGTRFFAVTVEALKIDGSQIAPYLRVVASPQKWSRRKVEDWRVQRAFQGGLEEGLRGAGLLGVLDDYSGSWMCIDETEVRSYEIDFDDEVMLSIGVQLVAFRQLERHKDAIESELGQGSLGWQPVWEWETNKESYITCSYPKQLSELSTDSWGEVYVWVVETYRKFLEVFEPRLKELGQEDSG